MCMLRHWPGCTFCDGDPASLVIADVIEVWTSIGAVATAKVPRTPGLEYICNCSTAATVRSAPEIRFSYDQHRLCPPLANALTIALTRHDATR